MATEYEPDKDSPDNGEPDKSELDKDWPHKIGH
jgi:hypothetical protein